MASQKLDLHAEIKAAAAMAERRRGTPAWHERLPPDARAEAEGVKAQFRARAYGDLPKRQIAKVVQRWLASRAIAVPGEWAIVRWLTDQR